VKEAELYDIMRELGASLEHLDAVNALSLAAMTVGNSLQTPIDNATLREIKSGLGRSGALGKLATDPKQADKALVRECWIDWQKQRDRYDGKASFARDMRDKFPNLKSQPVIEGWCRTWESEA